jgi:thiaminase/transcriptional activator TenA
MFFQRLKEMSQQEWDAYTHHAFVQSMGRGDLPQDCFQHYLVQDYIFLIHFVRAYALAAYKGQNLDEIRQGAEGMMAILGEMKLHISFCEQWGIAAQDITKAQEARATLAYTRYVLDAGQRGSLLDLYVTLAPCVIGYAEIAKRLEKDFPETTSPDHPYHAWVAMYSGEEYQAITVQSINYLDKLFMRYGSENRMRELQEYFRMATMLETDFWQMGLQKLR